MNIETIQTTLLDEAAWITATSPLAMEVRVTIAGRLKDGSPRYAFQVTGPLVKEMQQSMWRGQRQEMSLDEFKAIRRAYLAKVNGLTDKTDFNYTVNIKEVLRG